MIGLKRKNIEEMVKQVNTDLTDKKQIEKEIDKFISDNNLIYNGQVNLEEIRQIFNENQKQVENTITYSPTFIGIKTYSFTNLNFSEDRLANWLMKLFLVYTDINSFYFKRCDIDIFKLRLYEIFFPRAMNEELNKYRQLLTVNLKGEQNTRQISQSTNPYEPDLTWLWWLLGAIGLITGIGIIIMLAVSGSSSI